VTMRRSFGLTRLHALRAPDVWHARAALTLYAVEPRSTVTVALSVAGLRTGDVAGLALFNRPYAWLGVQRISDGLTLAQLDERSGKTSRIPLRHPRVRLRAECDFVRHEVAFLYSTDGRAYTEIGQSHAIGGSPTTTHGIECALFSCSTKVQAEGGHADFDSFVVTTTRAGHEDPWR
jgi:xylan 1,4-beta-xylosidase